MSAVKVLARVELDSAIRTVINEAMTNGVERVEVVFLLTRMLAELEAPDHVLGQIMAAYDCAGRSRAQQ